MTKCVFGQYAPHNTQILHAEMYKYKRQSIIVNTSNTYFRAQLDCPRLIGPYFCHTMIWIMNEIQTNGKSWTAIRLFSFCPGFCWNIAISNEVQTFIAPLDMLGRLYRLICNHSPIQMALVKHVYIVHTIFHILSSRKKWKIIIWLHHSLALSLATFRITSNVENVMERHTFTHTRIKVTHT